MASAGLKANQEKWSKPLMDAGFTILPDVILKHQRDLEFDATDINIILHLARHWWTADNLPRPSKKTIAELMGIDPSTVRRRIAKMEKAGLIQRKKRFGSDHRREANAYDLSGLIRKATPLAKEMIERREKKRKARNRRLIKKRLPKPRSAIRAVA